LYCFGQSIVSVKAETEEGTYMSTVLPDSVLEITFKVYESEQIIAFSGLVDTAVHSIDLVASVEYQLLDSLVFDSSHFFFTLQFRDIIASRFLKLIFKVDGMFEIVKLNPYSEDILQIRPSTDKLIIGEQKDFLIYSSIPNNVLPSRQWVENQRYDYYVSIKNNMPVVSVLPKVLGAIESELNIDLRQPVMGPDSSIGRRYTVDVHFVVEKSNLVFLKLENPEYVLTSLARTEGVRTLIDNNVLLKSGHTYRITNAEEGDEVLVGELVIPKKINRNKAEAVLKLYNYHQKISGYLYIKDVDEPVFVTNFTVRPETDVHNIYIKRADGVWRNENVVFPGEILWVKLEGTSLLGEPIFFESDIDAELDSLVSDDNQLVFHVRIPKAIQSKKVEVLKSKTQIGKFLEVHEIQIPRKFDFVSIDFGAGKKRISDVSKPIFYEKSLDYFNIYFNPNKLDEQSELHGKQFFSIKIQMFDKNRKLIESAEIENICICPGENSVRHQYYDAEGCWPDVFDINEYLHNQTANLDDWATVIIEIKHQPDKYELPPLSKKIEVILRRRVNYDLDLSFPAGLLTKEFGTGAEKLNNFSGISLAMVAQVSFYQRNKIAKYQPFKLGVGFLAFNMFSMTAEVEDRDLGIVVLGSLYPSSKDRRMSFPLFLGGGYFLSKERFFLLVGPGIRISI